MVELQHSVRYILAIMRIYCLGVLFLVPDADACVNGLAHRMHANKPILENIGIQMMCYLGCMFSPVRRGVVRRAHSVSFCKRKNRRGFGFGSGRSASR